jgi:hypothetical protein
MRLRTQIWNHCGGHSWTGCPPVTAALFQRTDAKLPDAILAETYRNFPGASIAPVAFPQGLCCGYVTMANHKKTKRSQRLGLLPMHRIGDTFISTIFPCLSLLLAIRERGKPLHLVAKP